MSSVSLVASGERHIQIRAANYGNIGKLVALEGGRVELQRPQNGKARFYAAVVYDDTPSIRLVDSKQSEVRDLLFSNASKPIGVIEGAFVDGVRGDTIVLMERYEGQEMDPQRRLWCWTNGHEWTTHELKIAGSHGLWDARYFLSPMFGLCVHFVGVVTSPDQVHWMLHSCLFAVHGDWKLLHSIRRQLILDAGASTSRIWLSASSQWVIIADDEGHRLTCAPLEPYGAAKAVFIPLSHTKNFDVAVADIAWHGDTLAVLLTNGSVHMMELPRSRNQPLIDLKAVDDEGSINRITFGNEDAVGTPPWDKLVWIPTRQWLFASCGAMAKRIGISVEDLDTTDDAISPCTAGVNNHGQNNSVRRRRRRLQSQQNLETDKRRKLQTFSSIDNSEIVNSVRSVFASYDTLTTDTAFSLLGVLLQRILRQLGFEHSDPKSYEDIPIQVGIAEMMLAQIVLVPYSVATTIASKIVQAPLFCSSHERQLYYKNESHILAPTRESLRQMRDFRQCLTRSVQEVLSDIAHDVSTTDINALAKQAELNPANDVVNEGAQVLVQLRQVAGPHCKVPPLLRLRAVITLFAIISNYCDIDRMSLDVRALAQAIQSSTHQGRAVMFSQRFVERLVITVPDAHGVWDHPENRNRGFDVVRGLIVASGAASTFVSCCGASSKPKLFEILHSTQRRDVDDRISRALSREIIKHATMQLESLLRSSPVLPSLKKKDRPALCETTPLWVTMIEEGNAALDAFVKLVFAATKTFPLDEDIALTYIKSSSTTHTFDPEGIEVQKQAFKLSWIILHHIRQDVMLSNQNENLLRLHCELFLFDQLWSIDSKPCRGVLQFLNEAVFDVKPHGIVHGRVTGVRQNYDGKAREPVSANDHWRILRTLGMLLWSQWVRQRSSLCREAINQYRQNGSPLKGYETTVRSLGSMAASCALHLKTLALFRDPNEEDEISLLQLGLLEAAAELNPIITSNTIQWAFTPATMNARHLRRLRGIQAMTGMAGVHSESSRIAQYRNALHDAVLKAGSGSVEMVSTVELDVFGTCCCDGNFQRIVWALHQRRFNVLSTSVSPEDKVQIKKAIQMRPSSIDGLISRHEVANMLQAHRQQIADQIERLRKVPDDDSTAKMTTNVEEIAKTKGVETVCDTRGTFTAIMAAIESLDTDTAPDVNVRRRSHDKTATKSDCTFDTSRYSGMMMKGSSTQNVLKLLQLRKDNPEVKRHHSTPQMIGVPTKQPETKPPDAIPPRPTSSSTTKGIGSNRKQERILPLRHDHSEATELLLLSASGVKAKRSVPLSRKSFRLAIPPIPTHSLTHEDAPPQYSSCAIQCMDTRTTSMQTDEIELANKGRQEEHPNERLAEEPKRIVHSVSIGTQSQADTQSSDLPRGNSIVSSSITNRFPVYVDLENTTAKFLHISCIKNDTKPLIHGQDRIRMATSLPQTVPDPGIRETTPPPDVIVDLEASSSDVESVTEQTHAQIQERRRHLYRTHFPPAKDRLVRRASDRNSALGVDSFISLKSEMERMKAKLVELENSARDLDNDFKFSQHKLEDLSKPRGDERRSVIDVIDNVIDATDSRDIVHGALSTRAARDLNDARHLLNHLQQLTMTEQDST